MKPKYKYSFVNLIELENHIVYNYNVYKRYLWFFYRPVFSVEDISATKCRDACREYIMQHEND